VGANPFSVAAFKDMIIVAGFDDNQIYFLEEDGKVLHKNPTKSGPFQLLVREV